MKKARLWSLLEDGRVQCLVCERRCLIRPGAKGACGNYVNVGGELFHLGYGRLSALESRPIELKPLFHYWPNSTALTFSSYGCNFHCPWCQNYHLSFRMPDISQPVFSPEKLVELAVREGDEGLSASFNEPAVNFDFLVDVAEHASKRGLYFMLVTNGYFTEKALDALLRAGIDGWSISIKGCKGMQKPLGNIDFYVPFRNAKTIKERGGYVEIVYLVVTNTNDYEDCYRWIIEKHVTLLGVDTPLHINRYFPAYAWRKPPTPITKLLEIAEEAKKSGLRYVYVGNLHNPRYETTYCPKCGRPVIVRNNYRVVDWKLEKRDNEWKCKYCGYPVPIKGEYIPEKKWLGLM
ncbi:radical SAM protein [Thermofilum sp.]|jgi:pyruvate formate lyase activating enzyme|uniref:radical SAM protein n=1 Tax=Thermofilum sp. TaxID=1961369 RepID=UPI00258FB861|nr:radical SAM protein [Thermofilum sp.]